MRGKAEFLTLLQERNSWISEQIQIDIFLFILNWHLPINATAQGPVTIDEEVDSSKQEHHGDWIIEESQHKDGVNAIRSAANKKEHVRRNLKRERAQTQLYQRKANKRQRRLCFEKGNIKPQCHANQINTKSATGCGYNSTQLFNKCCSPTVQFSENAQQDWPSLCGGISWRPAAAWRGRRQQTGTGQGGCSVHGWWCSREP